MKGYEAMIREVTRCLAEDSHNEVRIIERRTESIIPRDLL